MKSTKVKLFTKVKIIFLLFSKLGFILQKKFTRNLLLSKGKNRDAWIKIKCLKCFLSCAKMMQE